MDSKLKNLIHGKDTENGFDGVPFRYLTGNNADENGIAPQQVIEPRYETDGTVSIESVTDGTVVTENHPEISAEIPCTVQTLVPSLPHQNTDINPFQALIQQGVSLKMAQQINMFALKKYVEVEAHHALKNIDYQYEAMMHALKKNPSIVTDANQDRSKILQLGNGSTNWKISGNAYVQQFISELQLVRERGTNSKMEILYREKTQARHIPIEDKELKMRFEDWCYSNLPVNEDIPQTRFDRLYRTVLFKIPSVKAGGYRKLESHQVAFLNGYYDLKEGQFHPFTEKNVFNRYSMAFEYDANVQPSDTYNAIKEDMFGGDKIKSRLADEFFGAILSQYTMKKIFVAQGVSNAGKGFFSDIICSVLGEDNVAYIENISQLTEDFIRRDARHCRLIYIADAAAKKITGKQASLLKAIAGGSRRENAYSPKILICTNHKLFTGEDGFLEKALMNRFAVIPFRKVMDHHETPRDDFNLFFDNIAEERASIAKQVLEAFHDVIARGGKFSFEYKINECVEPEKEDGKYAALTQEEEEKIKVALKEYSDTEIKEIEPTGSKVEKLFRSLLVLTDKPNPEMTTDIIIEAVNGICPNCIKGPAQLGELLRKIYGNDKVQDSRQKQTDGGKKFYNLEWRKDESPNTLISQEGTDESDV